MSTVTSGESAGLSDFIVFPEALLFGSKRGREEGLPSERIVDHLDLSHELVLHFRSGLHMIWEFPKIRGTLFWGAYNKDPTI